MKTSRRFLPPTLVIAAVLAALLGAPGCSDDDPAAPADPLGNDKYVFVDAANGADGAPGTKAAPLADLQVGIDLAVLVGKNVCVAEGTYTCDSSVGGAFLMAPTVSLYGGYGNDAGSWTRDVTAHATVIRDLATSGGTFDAPRAAIACVWDAAAGEPPLIDGFTIEGGGGDRSAGVFVRESASVSISNCTITVGPAAQGAGVANASTNRDSGSLVAITDCTVSGGGGATVTGIYVSRADLVVRRTVVTGLASTNTVFGIDCGYGDVVIADCAVGGGTAPNTTRGLYLNEAFTSSVTGCTIHGGGGGNYSYGIQAMDTEGPSDITGNAIDGGIGVTSVALELGWVEVNPAVDGNVIAASGGTNRFGIVETANEADPVSLTGNTFAAALLEGAGTGVFYRDRTAGANTDLATIAAVNALDENGLNPAGTVSGNVAGAP